MAKQYFNKISTNIDVLVCIFQHLEFEDQLRLALVNETLRQIFKHHIWRVNYRNLTVESDENSASVIVYNAKMQNNKVNLNAEQCKDFIKVYALDVESLCKIKKCPDDHLLLPRLTAISYLKMIVTDANIKVIADNCQNLQKLELRYCCNAEMATLVLGGGGVKLETLLRMKMLRDFTLENTHDFVMTYEDLQQLIHNSQLQHLHLTAKIIPVEQTALRTLDLPQVLASNNKTLQHLHISSTFDESTWGARFPAYLNIFQHLTTLSLHSYDTLNDQSLKALSVTCKRLVSLKLAQTTFDSIDQFVLPQNLEELWFYCCCGLSFENLRHILTQYHLKKFSSHMTKYLGTFEDHPISSSLHTLDIDVVCTVKFPSAYCENLNLLQLTWYDVPYGQYENGASSFNCKNLEKLIISFGHIPIESIVQLKSLHHLTLPQSMPAISWSYIEQLLRCTTLTELYITEFRIPTQLCCSLVPVEGFESRVQHVRLPLIIFNLALDFWLDIRAKSMDMRLECTAFNSTLIDQSKFYGNLLKEMINSSKFPKHVKAVQICGFKVDCKSLKNNCWTALAKINPNQSRILFPGDTFSIVL